MSTFRPDDLINCMYDTEPDEYGQCFRAKIVKQIIKHQDGLHEQPEHVKFLVSIEGSKADEIVAYNDILEYLEETLIDDPSQQV